MSLVTLAAPVGWPVDLYPANTSTISASSPATIDAADEKAAVMLPAPKTGNISKVWLKFGTVGTGGPTNVDVRIETVSTTDGNPSGTLWGTNTNCAISVASTDDNFWKSGTLTAVAAVTIGDPIAVVVVNPGAQSVQIAGTVDLNSGRAHAGTWVQTYTTSWGTKTTSAGYCITLEYDDGSMYFLGQGAPYEETASTAYIDTTSVGAGNQLGNKLRIALSGTVGFVSAVFTHSTGRGNVIYKVYRSADVINPIAVSAEWDRDIQSATTGNRAIRLPVTPFSVTVGEVLYVVVQAATAAVSVAKVVMKSGFATAYYPGAAGNAVQTTRTGSTGAFTDAAAEQIAIIGIGYTQLDDGTGPGHAIQHIGVM